MFEGKWPILSVKYKLVDEEFMKKAKAANKQVHVWTVNEEDLMQKMIDLGVSGIITNYPNVLKEVLAK